ncbi:MAG TPA: hypothetical protein VER03_15715 [Bryobacteraceae bacterium]|nr:hypothetical protein [Bryobacteraceae bacterium]
MRTLSVFSLTVLLLSATGNVATAQETLPSFGQTLEGTWIAQVAAPGGDFLPFGLGTFTSDGSYIGTTNDPTQSTHHGVWFRTGNRKFALSTMFFRRDANGVYIGMTRTRIAITLAEDLKSYEATVERINMDTTGKQLEVIYGIRGRSVRMSLETQRFPPVEATTP